MSQLTLERPLVDYRELLAQNPASTTLQYLNGAEFEGERALLEQNVYVPAHPEDWGHHLQEELESGQQTISLVAALGVYLNQMRPKGRGNELILSNAAELNSGQSVVSYWTKGGQGRLRRVEFVEAESGVLDGDGYLAPVGPYRYQLALNLQDRLTPSLHDVTFTILAIGDEAISELHDRYLGNKTHDWLENGYDTFWHRLMNSAIMQRLGLVDGNSRFEGERQHVLDGAMHLSQPDQMFPQPKAGEPVSRYPHFVELLSLAHDLDSQAVEVRVTELSGSDYMRSEEFAQGLIGAVAKIRAPYALDTLPTFEQKAVNARAAAEVYGMKALVDEALSQPAAR